MLLPMLPPVDSSAGRRCAARASELFELTQTNWGTDENTAYQAALAYATAFGTAYSRPWLFLISSSGD